MHVLIYQGSNICEEIYVTVLTLLDRKICDSLDYMYRFMLNNLNKYILRETRMTGRFF